jgi:hypothetical protein
VWFDLDDHGDVLSGSLWEPAMYEFTAYTAQGQQAWQMFVDFQAPTYFDLIAQTDGVSEILLLNGGALVQA